MLQPKRSKRRNMHKGRMKGVAQRGHRVSLGSFGLKAMESVWLTSRQIEAARVALTRYMKREGQVWIKVFLSQKRKTPTRWQPKSGFKVVSRRYPKGLIVTAKQKKTLSKQRSISTPMVAHN